MKKTPAEQLPAVTPLNQHARTNELAEAISRCTAVAWSGKCIRCTGVAYANEDDLVTGDGSLTFGGRYNGKGSFRAVYVSLDLGTATDEFMAQHRRQGRPDVEANVFPFVVVSLEVDVERVLDLTDAKVRRVLKVRLEDLTGELWQDLQEKGQEALTQAIGWVARDAGFQGILFPSAAKLRGKNLALFPDRLPSGGLRILFKEKLPKRT